MSGYRSKLYLVNKKHLGVTSSTIRELEETGDILRNPNPYFLSPIIMIPKLKKNEYRMVVNFRRCNYSVKCSRNGLSDIEARLSWLQGNGRYFKSVDGISIISYSRVKSGPKKFLGMIR
eukprot:augustus_masked-scaffold_61-processed-gene-0.3-mRNA-1 protein AED:1.00 eAED:1.00 QI:0/-1/0/0/-1/1/1/0/118